MFIKDELINTCSNHAPSRKKRTSHKPHIPVKRRSLLNIRRRLNAKINKCKYLKPYNYEDKLNRLNKRKADIEIKIRDAIREEAIVNEKKAIEKIKTNPRAFYTFAKQKSKTSTNIGPLIDKDNQLQSDPRDMSNILQEQYQKAFSNPVTSPISSNPPSLSCLLMTVNLSPPLKTKKTELTFYKTSKPFLHGQT